MASLFKMRHSYYFFLLACCTLLMVGLDQPLAIRDQFIENEVETDKTGKKWALLIAGSNGWYNYRHQADICHAYQILKKGGLDDENIIVFMYDDIANDPNNPVPGVILNKPDGDDVYAGVAKDYTHDDVNVNNFYAAILGNRSAAIGGSGKVLETGPDDHIFIYYADHGGPGMLGMPSDGEFVSANDFVRVLKKKHEAKGYKSMVIYVEACESGSIFDGLLPKDIGIYATTAANPSESSWGYYCSNINCLGDLYSIGWMEDSDMKDLKNESLIEQYETVKKRTAVASHVMEYGDVGLRKAFLSTFLGVNPFTNATNGPDLISSPNSDMRGISQREIKLHYLREEYARAPLGSHERKQALKRLKNEESKRQQEDERFKNIATIVMENNNEKSDMVLKNVRPFGQPLVDDWDCFKKFVQTYEAICGRLSVYGRSYTRAMANMCNAGVEHDRFDQAAVQVCSFPN